MDRALKIDTLNLDLVNPRIIAATSQREMMQRVIDDQDAKLVELAESIVADGLNPMERCLVLADPANPGEFIVLEGNRRLTVLKILKNPNLLTGLDVAASFRKRFETLATEFAASPVKSVACFEVKGRSEANNWIALRHTGENDGKGTVQWSRVQQQRFAGGDPALQALDFVREYAELSDEESKLLGPKFPLSTLERLIYTPDVRKLLGIDIKESKLTTRLPASELLKPLRKIILDLAQKKMRVTALKSKAQMLEYVSGLKRPDSPDLSKAVGEPRTVEDISKKDFADAPKKKSGGKPPPRKADPSDRKSIVPKGCPLNVANNRAAEIYKELRTLRLEDHPNAIAVLFRVFLELSTDQYLTQNSISLDEMQPSPNGGSPRRHHKKLKKKIKEATAHMIAAGAQQRKLNGILSAVDVVNSPLSVDLMHEYVHNLDVSPTPRTLKSGWDNAQEYLVLVWPQ